MDHCAPAKNRWLNVLVFVFVSIVVGCTERPDSAGPDSRGALDDATKPALKKAPSQEDLQAGTLRIEVIDRESGAPVTGLGVRLFYITSDLPGRIRQLDAMTTLDGEAKFNTGPVTRAAIRTEYDLETSEIESPSADGEAIVHRVQTSFEVAGKVLGPDGRGVEGATVFLTRCGPGQALSEGRAPLPGSSLTLDDFRRRFGYDLETEVLTDKNGAFSCKVKTCRTILAAVFKEGLLCPRWYQSDYSMQAGRFIDLTINLHAAAHTAITVYDARNRPMPNYPFMLIETFDSCTAHSSPERICLPFRAYLETDESGGAAVDLPAGLCLDLEGYFLFNPPEEEAAFPDAARTKPLDRIELAAGTRRSYAALPHKTARLQGTVRDEQGDPIQSASVILPVNSIQTDEQGEFLLLVPYNNHRRMPYLVSKSGYRSFEDFLPPLKADSQEIAVTAVLTPVQPTILSAPQGINKLWLMPVQDPEKNVLSHSDSIILRPDPGALLKGIWHETGILTFEDLEEGPYTVLAQHGRFQFARLDNLQIDGGSSDGTIDLGSRLVFSESESLARGRLQGRVNIPEGALPQAIAVTILRTDLPEIRRWDPKGIGRTMLGWEQKYTGQDGTFSFDQLPPGRYVVAAAIREWDRRIDAYGEIQIEEGANEITLIPALPADFGRFELTVTGRDGTGLPGICLLLRDPVDAPLGPPTASHYFFYTNGDGKIVIDRLPPGRYSFSLSRYEGREPLCEAQVQVGPGELVNASIVLDEEPQPQSKEVEK